MRPFAESGFSGQKLLPSSINRMSALVIVSVSARLVTTKVKYLRPTWLQLLAVALGILMSESLIHPANAQVSSNDVFTATLGDSITTDSNLFRKPGFANPQSDINSTTSASLKIDKPYSQQRFQLQVTENLSRYNKFSYLNFDATNYRGAWFWNLSPRLNASFNADRSKSLAPFEDTLGTQRNVSISENRAFNLDGWVFGGWHWLAGISRSDQKSEQAIVNQPDQSTDSAEAGIKYVTQSGNSVAATRRSSKGDYLNQGAIPGVTGNGFRQNESELKGNWKLSEKSELTGRLARQERSNNQIGQRDFSGPSADLGYAWTPTSKLSVNVSATRSTTPLQDPSFSYIANDALSFTTTWLATSKITMHVNLTHANSEYRGEGVVPASGPARKDTQDGAEVGVDWSPVRNLSLTTSLSQQRRSSNNVFFEYDDKMANISVSWRF